MPHSRLGRTLLILFAVPLMFWGCANSTLTKAPVAPVAATTQPSATFDRDAMSRIRDEGLNRSRIVETLSYLTDVIGPRLTGSPAVKRANEWTSDRLTSWGLENAHLESWGPFGRGWTLKRFSIEVIEPQAIPLVGYPKAWSPGFDQPLVAEVVWLNP